MPSGVSASNERNAKFPTMWVGWCALLLALARPVTLLAETQKPSGQAPAPANSQEKTKPAAAQLTPEGEEARALNEAIQGAEGDPQRLIRSLEEFLAKFPSSARREQIERVIFKQSLASNDPATAADYAAKLLERHPADFDLLAKLVELLDRAGNPERIARAEAAATRSVEEAERAANDPKPADVSPEEWSETRSLARATAYLLRGKVFLKAGEAEKAYADFQKSFDAHPAAESAERLADLAAKKGATDQAIEFYATAFAFPGSRASSARRQELRRKLGSVYIARHHSEKGLGDAILARYDALAQELESRRSSRRSPNAGARDPFEFVLERPGGPSLALADFRGKVLALDFWATWCGPCREEGKVFERVAAEFRAEPGAAFVAVNVDEDRALVPPFLAEEQWKLPVAFAGGLDELLGVTALPTVFVFDSEGRVAFRREGFEETGFAEVLDKKLREVLALRRPAPAPTGKEQSPKK